MSESKSELAPALPVSQRHGVVQSSSQLDAVAVANKLISPNDEELKLVTRTISAAAMTVIDLYQHSARDDKLPQTERLVSAISKSLRQNSCAEGGWRAEQVERILVADLDRMKDNSLGVKDGLFKQRG